MTGTGPLTRADSKSISDLPRGEYPRPQFTRQEWLNLNGIWEFEFDDTNRGLKERWASSPPHLSKEIRVPFSFETALSGIGDYSFHSCVWYKREFSIPREWRGQKLLL